MVVVQLCVCLWWQGADLHEWGLTVGVLPRLQEECFMGEMVRRTADRVFTALRPDRCPSQPRRLWSRLPPPVPPAPVLRPLHPRTPRPHPSIPAHPSSHPGPRAHPQPPSLSSRLDPGGPSGPLRAGCGWNLEGHPASLAHTPAASRARDLRFPIRSCRSSPTSAAEPSATLSKGDESR